MTVLRGRRYAGTTVNRSAGHGSRNCVRSTRKTSSDFAHQLLFYVSADDFLATTVPFLQSGIAPGDALLAVTSEANIRLLRDALGDDADLIDFAAAVDWNRSPAQTLTAYSEYVNGHPGRRVRIICEPIWHGCTEAEIREWIRYESMYNIMFADSPVLSICPFDVRVLSQEILTQVRRIHPGHLIDATGFPKPNLC